MNLKLPCLLIMLFSVIIYAKSPATTSSDWLATNSSSNSIILNQNTVASPIQRVRLRFSSEDGLRRPLLLGFTPDNAASDGFDYGYDALNYDQFPNDMYWNIEGKNYVIQGVGAFHASKAYPLNINITNAGLIKIGITDLENFNTEIDVFVYDSLLDTYTQINSVEYEITLEAGIYESRFFIAFSSDDATSTTDGNALSITDNETSSALVSYLIKSHEIYIKSAESMDIEKVRLFNIMGQTVMTWNKKEFNSTFGEIRIPVVNIPEGTYIISAETSNATINKKAIITY